MKVNFQPDMTISLRHFKLSLLSATLPSHPGAAPGAASSDSIGRTDRTVPEFTVRTFGGSESGRLNGPAVTAAGRPLRSDPVLKFRTRKFTVPDRRGPRGPPAVRSVARPGRRRGRAAALRQCIRAAGSQSRGRAYSGCRSAAAGPPGSSDDDSRPNFGTRRPKSEPFSGPPLGTIVPRSPGTVGSHHDGQCQGGAGLRPPARRADRTQDRT